MYEDASGTCTSIMNSYCQSLEEDVPFGHLSKMGNRPETSKEHIEHIIWDCEKDGQDQLSNDRDLFKGVWQTP
jgi:hypothetical protein